MDSKNSRKGKSPIGKKGCNKGKRGKDRRRARGNNPVGRREVGVRDGAWQAEGYPLMGLG